MSIRKLIYRLAKIYWRITRPITVGVRIMMIKDNKVLLVKHTYQDRWYIPGGGVKKSERLDQAIRREVLEELGGELGAIELFGAYTNFFEYKNDHVVIFYSEEFLISGETDSEIGEYRLFDLDKLPANISPGSKRRIEEYLKGEKSRVGKW